MQYFFLIIIASLIEYLGDSNYKFYARSNQTKYLVYGTISYFFLILMLIYLLKHSNVMYMNSLWDATSIILESFLAYVILKETLTNKYQYIGLMFIIVGIILLNVGKVPQN